MGNPQDVIAARVRALAGAQRAVVEDRDPAARFALRQALVDLSAACELAAAELPVPDADREGWRARHRQLHREGVDLSRIAAESPYTRPTIAKDLALT